MSTLVLTLIGPDRAGLVEVLAEAISAHQANWLESRMSRLSGRFAGILEVEVPDAQADALIASLTALDRQGLRVVVEPIGDPGAIAAREFRLELVGQDRPGIVREISRSLAALQVNVEELRTWRHPAPMSGEMLFSAVARLALPASVPLETLRERLERIASDLMVDLNLGEHDGA